MLRGQFVSATSTRLPQPTEFWARQTRSARLKNRVVCIFSQQASKQGMGEVSSAHKSNVPAFATRTLRFLQTDMGLKPDSLLYAALGCAAMCQIVSPWLPACSVWASSLWTGYCSCLEAYPVSTKLASGVVCTYLGDLLAQLSTMRSKNGQYDVYRALRLIFFQAAIGTPVGHLWYNLLDQVIVSEGGAVAYAVVSKVALDQLVLSPIMLAVFLIYMKAAEGQLQSLATAVDKEKFTCTLLAGYKLWPAAHVINFAFIPTEQRILYVSVVSVLWTAIASRIANEPPKRDPAISVPRTEQRPSRDL